MPDPRGTQYVRITLPPDEKTALRLLAATRRIPERQLAREIVLDALRRISARQCNSDTLRAG
jgi:hypothetical protein